MASASFVKLRRLAPRSVRVLARRAPGSAAIAAFRATLDPKAKAYVVAYDAAVKHRRIYDKELAEGHTAVGSLRRVIAAWVPSLTRDVPGFDASDALEKGTVPDDVIAAGEKMIEVVDEARRVHGITLDWADSFLEEMGPAFAAAVKEWTEAEAADKQDQDLRAAMRQSGALFDAELQLFRRVLFAVGGRSDADYQKLRSEKAAEPDPDDESPFDGDGEATAKTGKKPVPA